ncbi:hypothetical protein CERZMDRAFT_89224 [Cercospora zeae-maydis SCOH1-5]|uniref:Glucose-methanol-choline oxidoreductase N-terminal domain-containing protein n=1 Tax=Cercospora zeae-maydis SCOH1-5 TaxID=717836 RepID=A0A6A6EZU2_9PEZI|nr:hypothetical protein CERZMDRAFT_89224 [Cercospora zeae-maydis SCOH1-5]
MLTNIVSGHDEIEDHVFDYIVVGGGTTGLTVAARLSENPDIQVLIIESGYYESRRNPEVQDLSRYGRQFGTAMDHVVTTQPQKVDNRAHLINSGNGLGGSTLINGGAWTRPAKAQIDSWQSVFGNDGWTWEELLPHMKRIENVRRPLPFPSRPYDERSHGTTGAVHIGSFDTARAESAVVEAFREVGRDRKFPLDHDLSSGTPRGISRFPVTVTADGKRCDAATAWLELERPNVKILVGQYVGKVLFQTSSNVPRAIGVEYGRYREQARHAHARMEVILAAGALVSPLILEYSGIGLSRVLTDAGIEQIVDLPVGLSHQDQANTNVVNIPTEDAMGDGQIAFFASFDETFGDLAPQARALLHDEAVLQQMAEHVVASGGFQNTPALLKQYKNYIDHIENHDVAFSELLLDTWGEFGFSVWSLLPFGRGYIHIRSSDPYLRDYDYNPQFLSTEIDVLAQAAASKLARDMVDNGKLAEYRKNEQRPGLEDVPQDSEIDAWIRWVKSHYRPNLHAVGTCSMMRRDMGGVVNSKAQVYGSQGLRVVDASIVPTQVSSHMMALLYGMADKIAMDILGDYAQTTKSSGIES